MSIKQHIKFQFSLLLIIVVLAKGIHLCIKGLTIISLLFSDKTIEIMSSKVF